MSAWIVYSKDGKTQRCELKRLEYSGSHMGERAVTATFEHHSEVAFDVFDYIVYRGEKFELESIPSVKKVSRNEYEYELRFVSLKYELERCEMRDIVPNDNGVVYPTPLTFSFTGDVRYLAERIQANLDALYGKGVWNIVVAEGVSSDEKNISIAQQNCWNALSLVNTTYGLNFSVRGREVVIGGEIDAVSHTFQYGKGNGLYEIERASDTEIGIVTKLRAYGSTKNLDYSYPKKPEWADSALPVSFALSPLRLMLPSFKEDGKTDYVLADDAVISKYGIREASIVYEDIYPSIAGATNENGEAIDEIASVDEIDESKSTFVVYLRDLGFDLEEHLTTSEAQLSMKTGTLQGYTFNISVIDRLSNGGYKLTLGRNSVEGSEESGFNVPNKDWNMKAGDKFVLLNILMPQAYIREAEQRLLIRAKEYLAEYGKTNFSYNVGLHDKFLVEHPSVYDSLVEGVKLRVQDNELGISEDVIIQSITITEASDDNILPQVKVTLNNKPSASTLDRIQGKLNDVIAETSANNFSSQNELMAQYRKKLDKPFFDKLFSAVDANGNEIASNDVSTPVAYIKAKYDVLVLGGVTMYGNDESLDLPTLAEGLPFDKRTIWFNPETKQIEVIGGTGGGVADSVLWDNVEGKPSWITNTKPTYSYSEIQGTPDLSGYATTSALNAVSTKLNDFATILTGKADKSYVDTNFVTIAGTEDVTGLHNFVNGLEIGGLPITKKQDDVVYLDANLVVRGGITMYGDGEGGSSVPLYSTLGSLENVDKDAIDAVASVDRVLFQSAGSNVWSWKALSEIGGGSSGGSVSGNYLPLSGGTMSNTDVVTNLNADLLDGYHINSLYKEQGRFWSSYATSVLSNGSFYAQGYSPVSGAYTYGSILNFKVSDKVTQFYITDGAQAKGTGGRIFFRDSWNAQESISTRWLEIITSENIENQTVSKANQLTTARTIWGQSFDGTADITTGDITAYAKSGGTTSLNLLKASGDVGWQISGRYSSNQSGLRIYYFDKSNYNEYLHIGVDGNIGVHTNTPGYAIDINGGLGIRDGIAFHTASSLTLLSIKNANNYGFYLKFHSNQAQLYNVEFIGTYGSQNYIDFGCGAGSNTVDAKTSWMRLIKGKLGIGTLDPSSPLHVIGDAAIRDGLYMARASDNSYNFFIGKESGTIFQILNGSGGGEIHLRTNNSSTISSRVVIGGGSTTIYNTLITKSNITLDKASDNNASINLRGTTTDLWQISARYGGDKGTYKLYYYNGSTWAQTVTVTSAGNVTVLGGITMYSDQRKKTILNHVELSLKQIADAPLIEHYYNSDQDKTTHVGSIAQYWAQINDWFCKLDNEGYYTMEIQNCALASAISIARHLEKYESKTDKKIRMLKKRVKELEDKLERLEGGNYGCN